MPRQSAKNERIVDASPTKDFFISMLVRDIELIPAVVDLVDNSVDGAARIRRRDFKDLWVRLQFDADSFEISDNCGGITLDLARHYAFRFGRPPGTPALRHSIGQFGVGMKRALFKIGRKFSVESTTDKSYFLLKVDVDEWSQKTGWDFEFEKLEKRKPPSKKIGTNVVVTSLHPGVAEKFELENFEIGLRHEIADRHQLAMDRGMSISVNGVPLNIDAATLFTASGLKPANRTFRFDGVAIRLMAGIGESDPDDAGWYVYCNGRMIVRADQTRLTGWGETAGRAIPKYHNQFARFRGFAFFDSDDPALLPWNTTKTSVDSDAATYRTTRLEMISMMRPVIDFLNRLAAESEGQVNGDGPLQQLVRKAAPKRVERLALSPSFVAPKPPPEPKPPQTGSIQYRRPIKLIKKAQRLLKVDSYRAVGEGTFDYFLSMEADEDE